MAGNRAFGPSWGLKKGYEDRVREKGDFTEAVAAWVLLLAVLKKCAETKELAARGDCQRGYENRFFCFIKERMSKSEAPNWSEIYSIEKP